MLCGAPSGIRTRDPLIKSQLVDHHELKVLAPPVGLEPTTPCNNPTDSATLRQLRKFALSASSEGQTLRSAALRAAIC